MRKMDKTTVTSNKAMHEHVTSRNSGRIRRALGKITFFVCPSNLLFLTACNKLFFFTKLRIKILSDWSSTRMTKSRQTKLVSGDKMTVAGCDVSATGVVVVSKTSGGPRGSPDGPGDHYASHPILSTVAPWRQSRSRSSPCGAGCQSPSLALLSLPDLQFSPFWFNFLGSSG